MKSSKPPAIMSPEQREEFGKSRREMVSRAEQSLWVAPTNRRNPLDIIIATNAGREKDLVAMKMASMASSPFSFFRGTCQIMAADLATTPVTGLRVQMCGDAHVRNLGAFAAPDGHLLFGLNDFDETYPGPFEWDLKRMATSLVVAGNEAGGKTKECKDAVMEFVGSYRNAMDKFANMTMLDFARFEVHRHTKVEFVRSILGKAELLTPKVALQKMTYVTDEGSRAFIDKPRSVFHVPNDIQKKAIASLVPYRETIAPDRQRVLDAYHPVDVAFKVAGIGSMGTKIYVVLCLGNGPEDALFLQLKEQLPSCYAPHVRDVPLFTHQGRRVAEGQRLLQGGTDPFLGWTTIDGRDFVVRQSAERKASVDPSELRGETLIEFGYVCGQIIAKAHARSGDAAQINGYCGNTDKLDKALAQFALSYAEQSARDQDALIAAIKSGKIQATTM